MLAVLKKVFSVDDSTSPDPERDDVRLSAALLLLEAMHADHSVSADEQIAVDKGLQALFEISEIEARELRESAERRFEEVTSMHEFVAAVNTHFSETQKEQVVEIMWRIAHSDCVLDKYEDNIIRRVAELLHLSHARFIQAKHRATENNS